MKHLIFSEKTDFSVNRVIDWLAYYDQSFEKFIGPTENKDLFIYNDKTFSFTFGGKGFSNSSKVYKQSQINTATTWFRRPYKNCDHFLQEYEYQGAYPREKLDYTIYQRFRVFWDFIGYKLSEGHHFGSFKINELNKPIVLQEAQKIGLLVPKTLITNSKEELIHFLRDCNQKIITKPIHEVMRDHHYELEKDEYLFIYQMTQLLEELDDKPDIFAPSLFQEYIEKEYEIRTIYINGECYSTAIFSQLNEQTKIDMRNRDANEPTRYFPYKLDASTEEKINVLMNKLNLNFGAIDFIKSVEGDCFFLEINPVGQYGDVSIFGNYYLHKKIAEFLLNKKEKK
ncbi:hypothetical protein [Aquimarina longa]|uniref:hypothetical protein n=1 Tax=Aquimarina longa TaxID=1080221 RepID=UPI0007849694|nr:hypothetical protein [Aquimarina longa]